MMMFDFLKSFFSKKPEEAKNQEEEQANIENTTQSYTLPSSSAPETESSNDLDHLVKTSQETMGVSYDPFI